MAETGYFLWVAWKGSKWHLLTSKDRTHCGLTAKPPFLGVDGTDEYCAKCREEWDSRPSPPPPPRIRALEEAGQVHDAEFEAAQVLAGVEHERDQAKAKLVKVEELRDELKAKAQNDRWHPYYTNTWSSVAGMLSKILTDNG